jgi:hypothetical protein
MLGFSFSIAVNARSRFAPPFSIPIGAQPGKDSGFDILLGLYVTTHRPQPKPTFAKETK